MYILLLAASSISIAYQRRLIAYEPKCEFPIERNISQEKYKKGKVPKFREILMGQYIIIAVPSISMMLYGSYYSMRI